LKQHQQAARHDSLLKNTFLHLSVRRGRSKARVAVARKLLVRAYILLRDEIDYATYLRRTVAVGKLGISRGAVSTFSGEDKLVH